MSESKTPCSHEYVQTWHDAETGELVELWSCADCMVKFVPITELLQAESDLAAAQSQINAFYMERERLQSLLDETRNCFTRDDDLPGDLLPRIDAALAAKEKNDG